MVTKMGRPTVTPKVVSTRIRMTKDEANMLVECANILGVTKTEVIIQGIKTVYKKVKK